MICWSTLLSGFNTVNVYHQHIPFSEVLLFLYVQNSRLILPRVVVLKLTTNGMGIPSGYPAVPKAANQPILPSGLYCSGYPERGVLRPLIRVPCRLFLYPPWLSNNVSAFRFLIIYHIDCSLMNKIGVDRVHCLVSLDHIRLPCRVVVENVDSGRGHFLPSSRSTNFSARVKKFLATKM